MLFKIELFLLVLAMTAVFRWLFYLVMRFAQAKPVEMTWYQKLELMVAISYSLTISIAGF